MTITFTFGYRPITIVWGKIRWDEFYNLACHLISHTCNVVLYPELSLTPEEQCRYVDSICKIASRENRYVIVTNSEKIVMGILARVDSGAVMTEDVVCYEVKPSAIQLQPKGIDEFRSGLYRGGTK